MKWISLSPLHLLFAASALLVIPYCQSQLASYGSTPSGNATAKPQALTASSGPQKYIAAAWYAGWHGSTFTPQNISWSKYSQLTYAFATTTQDPSQLSLAASDAQLLTSFVSAAHQNGVKASLSIGGWTGSMYYSKAVSTASSRTSFAQAILNLAKKYSLDGIDFDWEFPGRQGIGCNIISSSDSSNFLSLLQLIRADSFGKNLVISVAVSLTPFAGPNGSPLSDVSQYASLIDWITIMDYDVWGPWVHSGVGPNAPLSDACAPAGDQMGSAASAVASWTKAKFPANKIALGVASYGHSYYVTKANAVGSSGQLNAYPSFDSSKQPHGDAWDGNAGTDQCGNPTPVGGIWDFWGLVKGNFLTSNGTVAQGVNYRFDSCSQTPYVYNPSTQVMVSYDDAQSFTAKGNFIKQMGLGGFAMWQAGGDYNDILLDAIRKGISS